MLEQKEIRQNIQRDEAAGKCDMEWCDYGRSKWAWKDGSSLVFFETDEALYFQTRAEVYPGQGNAVCSEHEASFHREVGAIKAAFGTLPEPRLRK